MARRRCAVCGNAVEPGARVCALCPPDAADLAAGDHVRVLATDYPGCEGVIRWVSKGNWVGVWLTRAPGRLDWEQQLLTFSARYLEKSSP